MGRKTEAREILAQLTAMKTRVCSISVAKIIWRSERRSSLDWLEKDAREQTGFEMIVKVILTLIHCEVTAFRSAGG
jgi:hypothetical protein